MSDLKTIAENPIVKNIESVEDDTVTVDGEALLRDLDAAKRLEAAAEKYLKASAEAGAQEVREAEYKLRNIKGARNFLRNEADKHPLNRPVVVEFEEEGLLLEAKPVKYRLEMKEAQCREVLGDQAADYLFRSLGMKALKLPIPSTAITPQFLKENECIKVIRIPRPITSFKK